MSRLESSKQQLRTPISFIDSELSKVSSVKRSRTSKVNERKKLVDYSPSSSEDSFLAAVDEILLSSENESEDDLTPIRLRKAHARHIIQSGKRPRKTELLSDDDSVQSLIFRNKIPRNDVVKKKEILTPVTSKRSSTSKASKSSNSKKENLKLIPNNVKKKADTKKKNNMKEVNSKLKNTATVSLPLHKKTVKTALIETPKKKRWSSDETNKLKVNN